MGKTEVVAAELPRADPRYSPGEAWAAAHRLAARAARRELQMHAVHGDNPEASWPGGRQFFRLTRELIQAEKRFAAAFMRFARSGEDWRRVAAAAKVVDRARGALSEYYGVRPARAPRRSR